MLWQIAPSAADSREPEMRVSYRTLWLITQLPIAVVSREELGWSGARKSVFFILRRGMERGSERANSFWGLRMMKTTTMVMTHSFMMICIAQEKERTGKDKEEAD